jgi:two-component system, LytTR family, response regulator
MNQIYNLPSRARKAIQNFSQITHLEADINYTHIYLSDGKQQTLSCTLKSFEGFLTKHNFTRIHRSYIVNENFILAKGTFEIVMKNGVRLPIARRRREVSQY